MKSLEQLELNYLPEASHSHVSRSLSPGSEKARKMTVGSGMRCYERYGKFVRLGSLARMLLESSTWHSTKCYLNWKVKATPAKRLLFQLAPSTPRIGGIGSGLLPTAKGMDCRESLNSGKICMKTVRGGYVNVREKDGMKFGPSLNDVMLVMMDKGLLGTPRATQAIRSDEFRKGRVPSPEEAMSQLIPTATSRDYKGSTTELRDGRTLNNSLDTLIENGSNHGLKLQPAFVEWMMGYPEEWTALSPSETQSFLKSRKK